MTKGIIMVFSGPVSPDKEAEYNEWYSGLHIEELSAPEGVRVVTRYKLSDTQIPGNEMPDYKYLSIYEIDDVGRDFPAMRDIKTTPSDAIHPVRKQLIYEQVSKFEK